MGSFVRLAPWQAHPPDGHRALAKTSLTLGLHQEDRWIRQPDSSVVFCRSVFLDLSLCQRSMEQLPCAKPFWCPWNEKDNSPVSGRFEESNRDGLEGVRSTEEGAEESAGGRAGGAELAGRDPNSEHSLAMPSLNSRGQQES